MGFNLYFAGSQNKVSEEHLKERNCLRLQSWHCDKTNIARWFEEDRSLFVDSGAFTAHTKGIELDMDAYCDFCNQWDKNIIIFAEMDKIPGTFGMPKTAQEKAEAPEISWANYLHMRERLVNPDKCLPIYHQGEDKKHLIRMLETTFDGKHIPYIGISPANDLHTNEKEVWIIECFKIIKKSSNPNIHTHAFGMTSLPVLERHPFYSADSTSWIMTAANGGILSKYGVLLLSEKGIHDKKHIEHLPKAVKEELISVFKQKGYEYEELKTDYKQRMNWNIDYLQDWAENYVYKPVTTYQNRLF